MPGDISYAVSLKSWIWTESGIARTNARGLLPYRGLGSGIKRALDDWPDIDFTDDPEGCLFTATVHRREEVGSEKCSEKGSEKIIDLLKAEPGLAAREMAERLGISRRAVEKQNAGRREDPAHRPGQGRPLGRDRVRALPRSLQVAGTVSVIEEIGMRVSGDRTGIPERSPGRSSPIGHPPLSQTKFNPAFFSAVSHIPRGRRAGIRSG